MVQVFDPFPTVEAPMTISLLSPSANGLVSYPNKTEEVHFVFGVILEPI